jgi:hypothetical protein
MDDRQEKQHHADPPPESPLVWVKSFKRGDRGRPLFDKQSIRNALAEIAYLPSIGLACPWIPGKAPREISPDDDISAIGLQHGVIATKTASIPKSALETVLLVEEKLKLLKIASQASPGLFTKVLGIQKRKFERISEQLRLCRNQLAHPDPDQLSTKDLDFTGIPEEYKRYARRLIEWNGSPYMTDCKSSSGNPTNK